MYKYTKLIFIHTNKGQILLDIKTGLSYASESETLGHMAMSQKMNTVLIKKVSIAF